MMVCSQQVIQKTFLESCLSIASYNVLVFPVYEDCVSEQIMQKPSVTLFFNNTHDDIYS